MKRAAVLALALAPSALALAARPMVTDDARIAEAKACQVETWIMGDRNVTEAWALPACNPTGNLELAFGGARTFAHGTSRFTGNAVQAKTLLHALGDGPWGLGFTLGTVRRPARASANGWPGDTYFYVPLSAMVLPGERWVAHFNLGATRQRDTATTVGTWAFGNEVRLDDHLTFIPEVYRSEPGRPFFQLGLRYGIAQGRVQLTGSIGDRVHGSAEGRWFSLGVSVYPPAFAP